MSVQLDTQLKRLETARKKVETLNAEKQRLEGRIEAQTKALADLDKQCQDQFKCGLDDLPKLAEDLEAEAETSLKEAERILAPKVAQPA